MIHLVEPVATRIDVLSVQEGANADAETGLPHMPEVKEDRVRTHCSKFK